MRGEMVIRLNRDVDSITVILINKLYPRILFLFNIYLIIYSFF